MAKPKTKPTKKTSKPTKKTPAKPKTKPVAEVKPAETEKALPWYHPSQPRRTIEETPLHNPIGERARQKSEQELLAIRLYEMGYSLKEVLKDTGLFVDKLLDVLGLTDKISHKEREDLIVFSNTYKSQYVGV